MSSKTCTKKCNLGISQESRTVTCDGCKNELHENCRGLSSTELRCIPLKTRNLIFMCDGCRQGFKLLPQLMQQIADLDKEVSSIRNQMNNAPNVEGNNSDVESLCHEVNDSLIRSRNIMLYNIDESLSPNIAKRVKQDIVGVKNVLSGMNINTENMKSWSEKWTRKKAYNGYCS
ncbi:unnamed protein product [Psylliodes chrysocephalus]|uniref:Zinc finger PHD-type domain-containing protein n=1 Tax=Psylliodes chrysocephalus TaxID=3402493 RepID=A0A9P0CUM8_9CUCU|nr:unnamed protein product [Psylliodes chrysocephala]